MKTLISTLSRTGALALLWVSSSLQSAEPAGLADRTARTPVVQLALLLDTSNSMDGLIEQAKAEMKRITRVFVRRQGNWFKESDPNIHWFHPEKEKDIEIFIRNSLPS